MNKVRGEKLLEGAVSSALAGKRLDQALVSLFPDFSRAQFQQWIRQQRVRLNREYPRQRDRVAPGDLVEVRVPAAVESGWRPEAIPLDVVYEDEAILVLNKPAGLVVHPGAGNPAGTLLNALLAHAPVVAELPRAGIVHRLDKATSGLLVVAKTPRARLHLIEQLRARTLSREYLAVVTGVPVAGGTVSAPIGRHPRARTRMAVQAAGRTAVSHYRVEARYRAHSLVRVSLETGRTHQIRVHMAHLGHPIAGDPEYGGRLRLPADCDACLAAVLRGFKRQALHATALGLVHPQSGQGLKWQRPLPPDMAELVAALAADVAAHEGGGLRGRGH